METSTLSFKLQLYAETLQEEYKIDFSLIGILSKLSNILAENKIGIFAVSTYNTDYILVKKENFHKAMDVLSAAGYTLI